MLQILILVLFVSAAVIVIRLIKTGQCPNDTVLRKAVLEMERSSTSRNAVKHLAICRKCREKIDKMNKNES